MASFEETLNRLARAYPDTTFGIRPKDSEIIFLGPRHGNEIICACLHMYELNSMRPFTRSVIQITGHVQADLPEGGLEFCAMTNRFPTISIAALYRKGSPVAKSLRRSIRQLHEAFRMETQPGASKEPTSPSRKKNATGVPMDAFVAQQSHEVADQQAPDEASAAPDHAQQAHESEKHQGIPLTAKSAKPPRHPSLEPVKFEAPPLPPRVDYL